MNEGSNDGFNDGITDGMSEGSSDGSELKEGTEEGSLLGAELQVSHTLRQTFLAGGRLSLPLKRVDAQVFAFLELRLVANQAQSFTLNVPSSLLCQYLSEASWVPQST